MTAPPSEPPGADSTGGLAARFRRHLEDDRLLPAGSDVVVAVSGGIDSVTLLHLLRFGASNYRLRAAHFDHRMRPDSRADAEWVRGLCLAWRVPLEIGAAGVPPTTEADARTVRYAFLHDVAERSGAMHIVTAHHADDQAETVLYRILRGSGGLHGIPERRGSIVRPLLPFRRAEIEEYARAERLSFREDPTNVRLDRARNRIRHIALPALERTMPGAAVELTRLARRVRASEAAWRQVVELLLEDVVVERSGARILLARNRLLGYHRHIRGRVIRRVIEELGTAPGRAGTRAALDFIRSGSSGSGIELRGGLRLERHFDRILIGAGSASEVPDQPLIIPSPEPGEGRATIGGREIRVVWTDEAGVAPLVAAFDPTALRFPLELRAWRPGDRIRLAGGTRKLKKFFGERRVPRYDRHRTPLLAEPDGSVLWVPGLARAAGTEPDPRARVFHIQVFNGNDG